MKKRMLLLPLISGLVLSGCSITLFGKTITFGKDKSGDQETTDNTQAPKDIPIMEEIGDYKIATSIVAGHKYLLGSKRTMDVHKDEIRFFNGNYHIGDDPADTNSYGKRYSHYLGTSKVEGTDLSWAAELEAEDAGNGEFYFKVHSENNPAGNAWNNYYIGLYPSKPNNKWVLSFCLLETPSSTSFTVVDDDKLKDEVPVAGEKVTSSGTVISKFKYFEKYGEDTRPIKTLGFMFKFTDAGDTKEVGKFFGTEGKYSSFDCKSYEFAMDPDLYDLAHLYEKK